MASCKVCKQEIKNELREQLQCDYGFIIHLTKWGMIQKLQDAYADPNDSDAYVKEVKDEIWDIYKDYCETWGLDSQADNRSNKEYLGRDMSKRIVIPRLSKEEMNKTI